MLEEFFKAKFKPNSIIMSDEVARKFGIDVDALREEQNKRRLKYADEIIAKLDTVILTTCEEVTDIRKRALAGEFDLQMKSDE